MHCKSIGYETVLSSLIDACALVKDRKENLDIKRSFTTKQTIYSEEIYDRLLNYLSGEDENLENVIDNLLTLLAEIMKNMSSSSTFLDIKKEDYNDEFKKNLLIPFVAVLLFDMRFDFKESSPIHYFIDFISKNIPDPKTTLDTSIREYIRTIFKSLDIPSECGVDFKNFIGKISLNSSLKPQTIDEKVEELKSECIYLDKDSDSHPFKKLSLSLHGMRLVLYFKEYIDYLIICYKHATTRTALKNSIYWPDLNSIVKDAAFCKKRNQKGFYIKFNSLINRTNTLSIKYHDNLAKKLNKRPCEIFNYILNATFRRDYALKLLERNKDTSNIIHLNILEAFVHIYDCKFEAARIKLHEAICECDKFPPNRAIPIITKLYLALTIKEGSLRIKNNTLDPYIYKIISTEQSKDKLTSNLDAGFLNQKSQFSNDANLYTIIDSIWLWNSFINDTMEIDVIKHPAYDIEFTNKIESSLKKIYQTLDNHNTSLKDTDDSELRTMVHNALTTDELLENVITFIPNFSLYFALREINLISPALSNRMSLNSESISYFVGEHRDAKRKLLKAISYSEYCKDEENERNL